jgi:antigen 43
MTTTITIPGGSVSTYTVTSPGVVASNAGTRGGTGASDPAGVSILGATDSTLINTGKIFGGTASQAFGYTAVYIASSGVSVINQASATIAGGANGVSGVFFNVNLGGPDTPAGPGTVINFGTIAANAGGAGYGSAVAMEDGGFVSNATGGVLSGGNGVFVGNAAGTVINAGRILGNAKYGAIDMNTGGMVTNLTGGTISANGAAYGVDIYGAAGTVTNAGTINGGSSGFAVELAADYANRVVADQGAVFVGAVSGGAAADATLELASGASIGTIALGSFTNFGSLTFDTGADWLVSGSSTGLLSSATLAGFGTGDTLAITGTETISHTTVSGGVTKVTLAGASTMTLTFAGTISSFQTSTSGGVTDLTTLCFCPGTLIRTPLGDVPVEKLAVGDTVTTLGFGNTRRVVWVGKGKVLATRGRRSAATPVIVRQGALEDNVPAQDLHLTKAHSLYIDGVLIPVEFLVNHTSILWDDHAHEVKLYHVELDRHDVLFANGALAESYRDDGNRWLFQNANEGWDLSPQDPCAPVLTGGPVVDAIWERLVERAGPRRLPPLTDDPDLHLIVDGVRVDAQERRASFHVFRLPSHPRSVIIASRAAAPGELGFARDPRVLGVALRRVEIRQGGKFALLDAADERLTAGFHDCEPLERLRWTDGYAELPAEAFARFDKGAEVMLHLGGATQYPDDRASAALTAA